MVDFDDYVRARGSALLRFAYVLCADAHRAEDLVQEALVRCHRRWRGIERDVGLDAYVRKAIVRQYLSWRRARSTGDLLTDRLDEHGGRNDMVESIGERDAMRRALAQLPRRQRAVLVLRYYEDLPDQQIADVLGCSYVREGGGNTYYGYGWVVMFDEGSKIVRHHGGNGSSFAEITRLVEEDLMTFSATSTVEMEGSWNLEELDLSQEMVNRLGDLTDGANSFPMDGTSIR